MPDVLPVSEYEAIVQSNTALSINKGEIEIIDGKPVCNLQTALRLIEEYNRVFASGLKFTILSRDWVPLPGEDGVFMNAFTYKMDEAKKLLGLSPQDKIVDQPEEIKDKYSALAFPHYDDYSTPNLIRLFEDGKVKSFEDIFALIDDEKDPLGRVYIEACLRDARVNGQSLLERMSQRMDIRDLFPDVHGETEEMREEFRQLVDKIMGHLGFGPVKSSIAVVRM